MMQWFPISKKKQLKICDCECDRSEITAVLRERGLRPGRKIRHYRAEDEVVMWHWTWVPRERLVKQ